MMSLLGRERSLSNTRNKRSNARNARTKVFDPWNLTSKGNDTAVSRTMCTICHTLRGVTMKKVWWGWNTKPTWKLCQRGNNKCFPILYIYDFFVPTTITRAYTDQNTKKFALTYFSFVSLSQRTRSRRGAELIHQGEGRLSRLPKTALKRSYLPEISSSENRILKPRRKKKLLTESTQKGMIIDYSLD